MTKKRKSSPAGDENQLELGIELPKNRLNYGDYFIDAGPDMDEAPCTFLEKTRFIAAIPKGSPVTTEQLVKTLGWPREKVERIAGILSQQGTVFPSKLGWSLSPVVGETHTTQSRDFSGKTSGKPTVSVVGETHTTNHYSQDRVKDSARHVSRSVVGETHTTKSGENHTTKTQKRRRASGWIEVNYRLRLPDGKRQTLTHFQPGCNGPYYQYCFTDNQGVNRSKYLKKSKVNLVGKAIEDGVSVPQILSLI